MRYSCRTLFIVFGIAMAAITLVDAARLHPQSSVRTSIAAPDPKPSSVGLAERLGSARGEKARGPAAVVAPPQRQLLDQYCVACHSQRLKTGGLVLEQINLGQIAANAETLEKVVLKLRTGQMPPPGAPRPDKSATEAFTASLESALDTAASAAVNPGRPMIHRLNRTEYANAIRDLLALDIDARGLLPADDTDPNGF